MKKNNRHILHRVNLEINTDSEIKAFAIKANIDGFLKNELFPIIETLFDESVSPEDIKRYDSIDLKLDMKSSDDFEIIKDQLISQLRREIENPDYEYFGKAEPNGSIHNLHTINERQNGGNTEQNSWRLESDQQPVSSVNKLSNQQTTFLYFLESGQLPWYATPSLLNEFIHPNRFRSSLQNKFFVQNLIYLFTTNQNAFNRFIQQFDYEIIEEFILHLFKDSNIDGRQFQAEISGLNTPIKELIYKLTINNLIQQNYEISEELYKQLRDEILFENKSIASVNESISVNSADEPSSIDSENKLINQIQKILNLINLNTLSFPSPEYRLNNLDEANAGEDATHSSIAFPNPDKIADMTVGETRTEEAYNSVKDQSEKIETEPDRNVFVSENQFIGKINLKADSVQPEYVNALNSMVNKSEEIGKELVKPVFILETQSINQINLKAVYIQNAGLILAHPFLADVFKRTKCADDKSFIFSDKEPLAIHLLHYLATGKEQEMEYDLTFEKFLCGVPLTNPVKRKIALSDHDKIECDDLLRSMIINWPALKNTSPDGLRQMFLQRDGKLDLHKVPYKLYVERKAQDVLLNKLQWNISVVKLPWLKELLFIEW